MSRHCSREQIGKSDFPFSIYQSYYMPRSPPRPSRRLTPCLIRSGNKVAHLVDAHIQITGTEGLEIGRIEIVDCPAFGLFDYRPTHVRTLDEVKEFIETLSIVSLTDLEDGEVCGICRETFADLAATELALQLPCTHVFSDKCLVDLLGPKSEGFWEHDRCPLCRKVIPLQ